MLTPGAARARARAESGAPAARSTGPRRPGRAGREPRTAPGGRSSSTGRRRVAAALARRGVRERLMLALLLYERLQPVEVALALGVSRRQVERTRDALLTELRRTFGRGNGRARRSGATRLRRAA